MNRQMRNYGRSLRQGDQKEDHDPKQMRSYRVIKQDSDTNIRVYKPIGKTEYEEIPMKPGAVPKRSRVKPDHQVAPSNRACMVTPERHDVGLTISSGITHATPSDQYHRTLYEQYGFDPVMPQATPAKELKNVLCGLSPNASHQVEIASQYVNPGPSVMTKFVPNPDESPWRNIDTVDEIEQFIEQPDDEAEPSIRISDAPRVTVIAEKFTRFQKEDIEIRKLDTRIVCIEYDIFDSNSMSEKPVQMMRAFFSVKPHRKHGDGCDRSSSIIPPEIKKRYKISEMDLQNLSVKEIEVIDGKIAENKPYLDDLRRVLKKKQAISEKKNRNTLDLHSMYQMAKRETPPLEYDFSSTNLLSKAELDEVKELILQRCDSTANNGVSRRKIRRKSDTNDEIGVRSECIFLDLLRDQGMK